MQYRVDSRLRPSMVAAAVAAVIGSAAEGQVQVEAAQGSGPEEIFVTGSRISRQGFDAPTPVTAIDNDYLLDLGFVNVGAAVQQLPANKASLTPETNGFGSFNVGAQIANLRALGSVRTLTLVDGRRHIASTDTANVDLNLIPPLLLERTEIVTGGASAAYGSDAVAGVINVILDKDLEGVRWQADVYQTGEGDGTSRHLSGAGGVELFGGRGHLIVGGEYEDADGIDSCVLTRDWCRDLPGIVTNPDNRSNGQPRNIITNNVVLGNMTSAGMISGVSNSANTPLNAAGFAASRLYGRQLDAAGNLIPFTFGLPVNQTFQAGGSGFSRYETTNPRTPVERGSLFTRLSFDVGDGTNLFFETSFGMVESHNLGAARWFNGGQAINILRRNPYIPAELAAAMDGAPGTADDYAAVRLGKHWDDWGRVESHSDNDVARLVVGAEGELNDNWTWDAYYEIAYNDRHQYLLRQPINANFTRALDVVINPATNQPTCAALLSPNAATRAAAAGCLPINPFGVNRWDPLARDYVLGTLHEWYKMNENVVAGNVQGDLLELPGGTMGFAAGLEARRDNGAVTHDECSRSSCYWQNFGDDFAGRLNVVEGYAETAMPFLSGKPGVRLLELDVAARRTLYENKQPGHFEYYNNGTILYVGDRESSIGATTYKVSALYDPTEWLRIRATRSRDIRAPNFSELYERTESVGFTGTTNPWTGGSDLALIANTGNIDVRAEEGDTETFGVVFSPQWSWGQGLRLSVDWWQIEIDGAIARLGTGNIVDGCFRGNAVLCTFIDGEGPGGVMTTIRNASLNLDVYSTKGMDFEALYQFDLSGGAEMGVRLFATRTDEVVQVVAGQRTDFAGVTGPAAFGQPEWAMNGTLSYDRSNWGISGQVRYIDSGLYNVNWIDPSDPRYNPTTTNPALEPLMVNDNTIDSATYLTLSGRYRLPMSGERSWELFATINNALDEDPPWAPDGAYPTNAAFFDQIGRSFRVGIRGDFGGGNGND
jgi:outer membrane receptor protein involved in Fe transport